MSLVRNELEQSSFQEVLDHVLGGQYWLYTKNEAIAMIKSGAMDSYLKTYPVLRAACSNQRCADDLIREMVARGADINFRESDGSTALHSAAFLRNPKAVAALLELGANPLLQQNNGWYPLNAAVWQSIGDTPHWVENRDQLIQDEINRVKSIVTILITKSGNDPYFVYSSGRFQDKYAISDCNNSEVRKAMDKANDERLTILNDPENPMTKMLQKHDEALQKKKKDALLAQLKQRADIISTDTSLKESATINATVFDSAKPLVEQVKLIGKNSHTTDSLPFSNITYSEGAAYFEPVKMGNHYFNIVCKMNSGFDINFCDSKRYFFTIFDLQTSSVVLENISAAEIDWTLQCLNEFLLNKKENQSIVTHSIFGNTFSKEEKTVHPDSKNVLVKKNGMN